MDSEKKPEAEPPKEKSSAQKPAAHRRKRSTIPKDLLIKGGASILLVVIIVLGIIFIPKLFKKEETAKTAEELFDESIYIAVKENGKYGYINLKGDMKISPQFYRASDFEGDYALAETKDDEKNEIQKVIIDRKGETRLVLNKYDDAYYNEESHMWEIGAKLYNDKLKALLDDNQYIYDNNSGYYIVATIDDAIAEENKETGISASMINSKTVKQDSFELLNRDGKSIHHFDTPVKNLKVASISEIKDESYCGVNLEDKAVILNCENGKTIKDDIEGEIDGDDYTSFTLRKDGRRNGAIVLANNKVIAEMSSEWPEVSLRESKDGYYYELEEEDSDKTQYYIFKEDKITEEAPEGSQSSTRMSEWESYTGYTIISCADGYGIMSDTKQTIPCEYRRIQTPSPIVYEFLKSKGKDYVIGNKDDKSYLLNTKNGKVVREFNSSSVNFERNSSFIIYDISDDKKVIENLVTGKSAEFNKDIRYYSFPMYVRIRNTDDNNKDIYDYYDKNLKKFYTEDRSESD